MDKEDFVIKLKQYGLNDLVKDYREQIAAKVKEVYSSFLKPQIINFGVA
mgnify:CR=1 FL=1